MLLLLTYSSLQGCLLPFAQHDATNNRMSNDKADNEPKPKASNLERKPPRLTDPADLRTGSVARVAIVKVTRGSSTRVSVACHEPYTSRSGARGAKRVDDRCGTVAYGPNAAACAFFWSAKLAYKTGFPGQSKRTETHNNLPAAKEPLPHLNIRRAPVRQLAHEVVADGRQPHREVRPAVLVLAVDEGDLVVPIMLPHDVKIR